MKTEKRVGESERWEKIKGQKERGEDVEGSGDERIKQMK